MMPSLQGQHKKTVVDRLLTFNPDDFKRAWPEGSELLIVP